MIQNVAHNTFYEPGLGIATIFKSNGFQFWYDREVKYKFRLNQSKKISNDQEVIQSDPTSYPQNKRENN